MANYYAHWFLSKPLILALKIGFISNVIVLFPYYLSLYIGHFFPAQESILKEFLATFRIEQLNYFVGSEAYKDGKLYIVNYSQFISFILNLVLMFTINRYRVEKLSFFSIIGLSALFGLLTDLYFYVQVGISFIFVFIFLLVTGARC